MLYLVLFILVLSIPAAAGGFWVRGNTHTHTTESDGDASPKAVAEWYKSHGYQFLVITDHGKLTDPDKLGLNTDDKFLLIPGEEIGTEFEWLPVHVCALGIKQGLSAVNASSMVATIQANVDVVNNAGGLVHINHPNWHYSFDHRQLRQIKGCRLMEIYNASGGCNDEGDMAHIQTEQIWDVLLSEGQSWYGIASDDAHRYNQPQSETDSPGRGWIVVRVNKLTQDEVLAGIRKGDFYASTGVELAELSFDGKTLRIGVKPTEGIKHRIRFVGQYGRILEEVDAESADYKLAADAGSYVRAKVMASNGAVAWTQPIRRAAGAVAK